MQHDGSTRDGTSDKWLAKDGSRLVDIVRGPGAGWIAAQGEEWLQLMQDELKRRRTRAEKAVVRDLHRLD